MSGASDTQKERRQREILYGRESSILMGGGHSVPPAQGTDSNLCLLWVLPCREQFRSSVGL